MGKPLPFRFVSTDAVQEIEHGIFFVLRITGRGIDLHPARCAHRLGLVFDHLQLALWNAIALLVKSGRRVVEGWFVVWADCDGGANSASPWLAGSDNGLNRAWFPFGHHFQNRDGIRRKFVHKIGTQVVCSFRARNNPLRLFEGIRIIRTTRCQNHRFAFGFNLLRAVDLNIDLLRGPGGVHDLEINDPALVVAGRIKEDLPELPWCNIAPALRPRLPFARRDVLGIRRENLIAVQGAEHLLGIIRGRAVAGEGIVANQIGGPLHRTTLSVELADVDEQRGIAGQENDVRIALHAGHPRRVAEGPGHIRRGRSDAGGPFAAEDLRLIRARIRVVLQGLCHHFFHIAVIVFVH